MGTRTMSVKTKTLVKSVAGDAGHRDVLIFCPSRPSLMGVLCSRLMDPMDGSFSVALLCLSCRLLWLVNPIDGNLSVALLCLSCRLMATCLLHFYVHITVAHK